MEYCRNIKERRQSVILVAPYLLCVLYYIALIQLTPFQTKIGKILFSLCFLFFVYLSFISIIRTFVRFCFTPEGLAIQYPLGKIRIYPWEEFREAAICKVHFAPKDHSKHIVVFRFAVGDEKTGPFNATFANEFYSDDLYEVIHWKKIHIVEYSEERYESLKAVCTVQINDYRHLPTT
jgi:hypothetical protein